MIALLLSACFINKHAGTIDIIESGVCVVELRNHFHVYEVSVCQGRMEGDTIKIEELFDN